jgi:flagellar L-ring protein precursor FlgH
MRYAIYPLVALLLSAAGCATPLDEVGRAPKLSAVGSGIEGRGLSVHSYPEVPATPVKKFSLWDDRQSRLFTDARAHSTGDILTVEISINDRANVQNETDRSRDMSKSTGLAAGFGIGAATGSADADYDINSSTSHSGAGATSRKEDIKLRIAAVVTEVMPNGNLHLTGSQEVRVNEELRILTIAGIVRPNDIGANNTISYERIAEARISYGGRGRLSEVQQPTYGQQVLDNVLPF